MTARQKNIIGLPPNIGRVIVRTGTVIACPLLGTDRFVKYCKDRGLSINRERLLRLERLGLFAPVFRVRTPKTNAPAFSIPPDPKKDWFKKRWAWDTTSVTKAHEIPDHKDRTQEGYYSIFQLDHLQIVLASMALSVQLDRYLESTASKTINWNKDGRRWMQFAESGAESLSAHEFRRSLALLCQFISNRYYPQTQGDQRTIQISQSHSSDHWISINGHGWDWYDYVNRWKPQAAARLFKLTPAKLRHAYEVLAIAQARCDPLERWYQLTQFVALSERKKLKGEALRAETIRSGAYMLRLLYQDLYPEELPHPNEVSGTVITHVPELAVRDDTRRYLELVANRYGVNPQPRLSLIVEGPTEEIRHENL